MSISLRPFLPADAAALADLFRASISEIACDDYDAAQIDAWMSMADDAELWTQKLEGALTLLAFHAHTLAGFISLKGKDEIDMLYVAPQYARQGVASALLLALEKLAQARGASTLVVDASDSAEPFFKARGYSAQRRNTLMLADAFLGNTTMTKSLISQMEH